jgi:hypothetical protein
MKRLKVFSYLIIFACAPAMATRPVGHLIPDILLPQKDEEPAAPSITNPDFDLCSEKIFVESDSLSVMQRTWPSEIPASLKVFCENGDPKLMTINGGGGISGGPPGIINSDGTYKDCKFFSKDGLLILIKGGQQYSFKHDSNPDNNFRTRIVPTKCKTIH